MNLPPVFFLNTGISTDSRYSSQMRVLPTRSNPNFERDSVSENFHSV